MDSRLVLRHARLKQLVKDIASWEKERRKEWALQTPHTLFRAENLFRDWVAAYLDEKGNPLFLQLIVGVRLLGKWR